MNSNILRLPVNDIYGVETCLSNFHAKVYLLVNVASRCGFRYQYSFLETLYKNYQKDGLTVCGFPSNNFANQEPKSENEIELFCKVNKGVTFPLFSKINVKGKNIHPIYDILTKDEEYGGKIRWNFSKFLLDGTGHVFGRFSPFTNPNSKKVRKKIEEELSTF